MCDEERIESATEMVERAERSVQQAGFDPDAVVTEIDVENLTPKNRFRLFNLFIRKLELADALVACKEPIPNPENPYRDDYFKTNGTVIVVYEDDNPVWYMEWNDIKWETYNFNISILEISDWENNTPKHRLEVFRKFTRNLDQANKELAGESFFPNPFNPDGNYQYKTNGSVMVAYRQDNPVWYMRKKNKEWQSYQMTIFLPTMYDSIDDLADEIGSNPGEFEDSLRDLLDEIEDEFDKT